MVVAVVVMVVVVVVVVVVIVVAGTAVALAATLVVVITAVHYYYVTNIIIIISLPILLSLTMFLFVHGFVSVCLPQIQELYKDFHVTKVPFMTEEVRGVDKLWSFSEHLLSTAAPGQ